MIIRPIAIMIVMMIMMTTVYITIMIIMLTLLMTVLIAMLISSQAALLYTDADRRRRIRVINRQIQVVDDLPPLAASVRSRPYLGRISAISRRD